MYNPRRLEYTSTAFRKGTIGDYKRYFTPQDLTYFDSIASDVMAELGYYKKRGLVKNELSEGT